MSFCIHVMYSPFLVMTFSLFFWIGSRSENNAPCVSWSQFWGERLVTECFKFIFMCLSLSQPFLFTLFFFSCFEHGRPSCKASCSASESKFKFSFCLLGVDEGARSYSSFSENNIGSYVGSIFIQGWGMVYHGVNLQFYSEVPFVIAFQGVRSQLVVLLPFTIYINIQGSFAVQNKNKNVESIFRLDP